MLIPITRPARTIAVVGASLGGLRAVEALRAEGWEERIVVVGEEPHMPYTRPPLSKGLLRTRGLIDDVLIKLRPSNHETEWRLGRRVVASDLVERQLTLDDGSTLVFDGLVAATGVRSRRLPGGSRELGMVLRTFDESQALEQRLVQGSHVVIAGAGFIGCEVAAAAIARGCAVSVVALDRTPMEVPLGRLLGAELQRRHEAAGVVFHLGRTITNTSATADGTLNVTLDDGMELTADLLVEAIGSVPNVEWLEGNGLDLGNGVLCDGWMRMEGAPRAVAVGDVARFPNALFGGGARRVEHWQIAVETARQAAATLLKDLDVVSRDLAAFETIPSFWSDQSVASIRAFGSPGMGDSVTELEGELGGEAALGYHRNGDLVGVVLLGMAKRAGHYARHLMEALASSKSVPAAR